MSFEKVYSSMSSAKRGAKRADLSNPSFTTRNDGKIVVTEKSSVATTSTVKSPVSKFRGMFDEMYGSARRKDVIAAAMKAGIAKNTAATYYQKCATERKQNKVA